MAVGVRAGAAEVNGTELHYEIRGAGPAILFIPGAEGDAEEYAKVVERLDDRFTAVCYDRRAFSRSPRPAGFDGTSVDEQADDAAGLLQALGLAPAAVWGNSSGAIIGLSLVLRYPALVSCAMLHEPPLFAGMRDPEQVRRASEQMTAGGKLPFLRALEGEAVYSGYSGAYRARLAADVTWLEYEFDKFEYYRPADATLAAVARPVHVYYGARSAPFFGEAATWLSGRLGCEAASIPGGHGVHYEFPEEVARLIRSVVVGD